MAKHDGLAIIIGTKKPSDSKKSAYPKLSELLGKPSHMDEEESPDDESPMLAMEDFINAIHAKDAKAALEAYKDLCAFPMEDESPYDDRGSATEASDDDEE